MSNDCFCGGRFMDAEDFRDHLPCRGPRCCRETRAAERASIVTDLREKAASFGPIEAYTLAEKIRGELLALADFYAAGKHQKS